MTDDPHIREQILAALRRRESARPCELRDADEVDTDCRSNVHYHLQKLLDRDDVEKPHHGVYRANGECHDSINPSDFEFTEEVGDRDG